MKRFSIIVIAIMFSFAAFAQDATLKETDTYKSITSSLDASDTISSNATLYKSFEVKSTKRVFYSLSLKVDTVSASYPSIVVQESPDFVKWVPVDTVTVAPTGADTSFVISSSSSLARSLRGIRIAATDSTGAKSKLTRANLTIWLEE